MRFRPLPRREHLQACLSIDPDTGLLVWKERPRGHFQTANAWATWNSRWAGTPAFNVMRRSGYLSGAIDSKIYLTHRIVWKLTTGADPQEIDHIDGNPSNNSPSNLRSVDRRENLRNSPTRMDNKSGVAGVYWDADRRKWRAVIGNRQIGRFATKDAAIGARTAALESEGYHENHGRHRASISQ